MAFVCFFGNSYNLGAASVSQNGEVFHNIDTFVDQSTAHNSDSATIKCDGIYQTCYRFI